MSGITSEFTAKRFLGKPLRQPLYDFETIPKCKKNLEGSTIYEITNRDDYIASMAEMVLLCKEAVRRSNITPNGKRTSKPLSLEYIADRLDIDDPLWGYFVRDDQNSRLQGFITFTTFTNWQRSFRWDSISDTAFCYDSPELAQQIIEGERVCDDGSLAVELQQTVRCGDVYNEGIVWPRIAEISLLGGLGCGKLLLSQVIEKLETMKPNSLYNYDYIVLQATEKSIPFYQAMGFVRVGAIEIDENFVRKEAARKAATSSDTETDESVDNKGSTDVEPPRSEIISNPNEIYVVERAGETVVEIAKKIGVDVWDVVFLNQGLYKNLKGRSYLKKGTNLYIPSKNKCKADATSLVQTRKDLKESSNNAFLWYIAKENDTPKGIALKFGVSCRELVSANLERLPELLPISRLKEGTRVRVSHFDQHDDEYVPYTHWTSPDDDKQETLDPSYMMVKKLDRRPSKKDTMTSHPVSKYVSPPLSLFHHVKGPLKIPDMKEKKRKLVMESFAGPGKPKRPLSAYILYCNDNRKSLLRTMSGKPGSEYSKVLAAKWKRLGDKEKAVYQQRHREAKKRYEKDVKKYEENLQRFFKKHPEMRPKYDEESEVEGTLFNQVVKLKSDAPGASQRDSKYFYVLTYIPDLVWCHLAPMRQVGHWGDDKPECQGRPKWMLVDESEGKELDISADYCTLVPSRGMYRTEDADEECWDIFCEKSRPGEQFEDDEARGWENSTEVSTETESSIESISKSGKKRRRRSVAKKSIFENLPASKRSKSVSTDFTPTRDEDSICSKEKNCINRMEEIPEKKMSRQNLSIVERTPKLSTTKTVGRSAKTPSLLKKPSLVATGKVLKRGRGRPPKHPIQSKIVLTKRVLAPKSAPRDVTPEEAIRTKSSPEKRSVLERLPLPARSKSVKPAGTKVVKRGRPARHNLQSTISKNNPRDITPEKVTQTRSRSSIRQPPSGGGEGIVMESDVIIDAHQQEQKVRILPRRKANSSREGFYSESSPKKHDSLLNMKRLGSTRRETSKYLSHKDNAKLKNDAAHSSSGSQVEGGEECADTTYDNNAKESTSDVRVLPRRKANLLKEGFYSESSPSRKGMPLNALQSECTMENRSKNQSGGFVTKQYADRNKSSPKKPTTKSKTTPARRLSPRKSSRDFSRSGKSTIIEHSLNIASRNVIGRRLVVS
mmetsp:Transcript_22331/g.32972  ORF Transcript_22331/g.32972 Transcript_22331/m.32972 type:complete len:1176 (-) Transcript_22331:39-3566(-)|eukprot:CAMPEP_0194241658 /NCGR_PEP_ID=MMETSP0158-20130606/7453_1 /TAXON_ID=33649 /ORGANISM="Thalassionema nitzschioides, Strain L26-B" /LENGTH=1175 /DNA_ID=CAMNT_0038976593 /DNA_START=139 /DNA_END=3666 /DNA_ORIENTATION=+